MTARGVPEWIGKTPDTAIPPRVKLRVWERAGGCCEVCRRKIGVGEAWQADHTQAIINGGENREGNLRVICDWCHKPKTAADVAEKSKTARMKAKHLGAAGPKRSFATNRNGQWKKKLSGEVVRRN
jgi:5-methylcytosine-specific restriction enzyme A